MSDSSHIIKQYYVVMPSRRRYSGLALYDIVVPSPDDSKYPHKCPRCGGSAYLGGGLRVQHAPDDREECP